VLGAFSKACGSKAAPWSPVATGETPQQDLMLFLFSKKFHGV
jgi:hypothetical protein